MILITRDISNFGSDAEIFEADFFFYSSFFRKDGIKKKNQLKVLTERISRVILITRDISKISVPDAEIFEADFFFFYSSFFAKMELKKKKNQRIKYFAERISRVILITRDIFKISVQMPKFLRLKFFFFSSFFRKDGIKKKKISLKYAERISRVILITLAIFQKFSVQMPKFLGIFFFFLFIFFAKMELKKKKNQS